MIQFRFYYKDDPEKETISSWPAIDLEDAVDKFAQIKRLSVEQFKKLYVVERYDRP